MRKTFQMWLFVFMTAAFILVFSISFLVQTRQASDNAKRLIFLKIEDVIKQLEINNANLKKIRREYPTGTRLPKPALLLICWL